MSKIPVTHTSTETTITKQLPCVLSPDEVAKYADDLARTCEDIVGETTRQLDVKSELKARLVALEAQRSIFAKKVRRRQEERPVAVLETQDYANGVVLQTRKDTWEVIYQREMTNDERQGRLL